MIRNKSEKGQALILIALAIIGLIGMTGLTVDGGFAYADRRHAQNAADTAAFAAARAKVRVEDWKHAALAIANANGYADVDYTAASTSSNSNVEVSQCSENGVDCNITPKVGDTLENYLQVKITSTIKTNFGGVVGIWEVTNRANAVVRVKEETKQPIGSGSAIFSLNPNGCASVSYQGSAKVTLIGSGIFVSSTCKDTAFFNNSNSPGLTAPCLQAVGGIQYTESSIKIPNSCILAGQQPLPPPILPNPVCEKNAVVSGNTMSPGNWSGKFPPSGVNNLQSGVYCVSAGNQGFTLNANDVLNGNDVTIFMKTGHVTWNGQATIRINAPDSGIFKGLLLYLPPTNSNAISINGGGDSKIVGTVLAPTSECNVLGGGGQEGLQTQLACYDVKLGGGSDTTILYNSEVQYQLPNPPQVELIK